MLTLPSPSPPPQFLQCPDIHETSNFPHVRTPLTYIGQKGFHIRNSCCLRPLCLSRRIKYWYLQLRIIELWPSECSETIITKVTIKVDEELSKDNHSCQRSRILPLASKKRNCWYQQVGPYKSWSGGRPYMIFVKWLVEYSGEFNQPKEQLCPAHCMQWASKVGFLWCSYLAPELLNSISSQ